MGLENTAIHATGYELDDMIAYYLLDIGENGENVSYGVQLVGIHFRITHDL